MVVLVVDVLVFQVVVAELELTAPLVKMLVLLFIIVRLILMNPHLFIEKIIFGLLKQEHILLQETVY